MILPSAGQHHDRGKDQEALVARYEAPYRDDFEDEFVNSDVLHHVDTREHPSSSRVVPPRWPRFLALTQACRRVIISRTCRRVTYILLAGLLLCLLGVGFVAKIVITNIFARRNSLRSGRFGLDSCLDAANWTTANTRLGDLPHKQRATFNIPVSALEISFLSEGTKQHGHFEVVHDHDAKSEDAVIDIHVTYDHSEALSGTTVCRLHPRHSATWGLGIFTSHKRNTFDDRGLNFHIQLRLPAAPSGAPLKINRLLSDMPRFSHSLPRLADTAYFETIDLRTENAYINVDSLAGSYIRLQTSNAAISGRVDVSTSMSAQTSNAPISLVAELVSDGTEHTPKPDGQYTSMAQPPTTVWMKSSNGPIDSTLTLRSNSSDGARGNFRVHAETSRAPLKLAVVNAPLESDLDLYAHTSLAPAEVALHKTFEGGFELATSFFFRPQVTWTAERPDDDPAGLGRRRWVSRWNPNGRKSVIKGHTRWRAGASSRSWVDVGTSISPVSLRF